MWKVEIYEFNSITKNKHIFFIGKLRMIFICCRVTFRQKSKICVVFGKTTDTAGIYILPFSLSLLLSPILPLTTYETLGNLSSWASSLYSL